MKQYVVDELRLSDYEKIKEYLVKHFGAAEMGNIYWLPIDEKLYSKAQSEHKDCHPLFFTIQLEENLIAAELLVRTKQRIRCECIKYANMAQMNWLINIIDSIFEKLEIKN